MKKVLLILSLFVFAGMAIDGVDASTFPHHHFWGFVEAFIGTIGYLIAFIYLVFGDEIKKHREARMRAELRSL